MIPLKRSLSKWLLLSFLIHGIGGKALEFLFPLKNDVIRIDVMSEQKEVKKNRGMEYPGEGEISRRTKEREQLEKDLSFYEFEEYLRDHTGYAGIVPESYLSRAYHFLDILTKDVLFSIETFDPLLENLTHKNVMNVPAYRGDKNDLVDFIQEKPPLYLSEKEQLMRLDEMMSLPKEEQFKQFEKEYLTRYDPEKGDLADFFRKFYLWNMVRLNYPTDILIRVLTDLEENLDKGYEYNRILDYIKDYADTKTGIEMLFMLEYIYYSQENLLISLSKAYPIAKKNQHEKGLIKETIIRVYEKYRGKLTKESLLTEEGIIKKYDARRREILTQIISYRGDGYRVNDALYKLGVLSVLNEDYKTALSYFTRIDLEETDGFLHKDVSEEILSLIRKNADIAEIRAAIQSHEWFYLDFLDQRGREFIWDAKDEALP